MLPQAPCRLMEIIMMTIVLSSLGSSFSLPTCYICLSTGDSALFKYGVEEGFPVHFIFTSFVIVV